MSQALSITNTAVNDGFSEKLNAGFGGVSDARITTNGGSISLLAPGATNNTSMVVGLNTAAAGVVSGSVTVNLESDGTGTSGFGALSIGSQNVGVSGTIESVGSVFRLAQPSQHTPEPVNLGNVRVGATAQQALTISNLAPNDGFSEKLNASIGGATAGITASGSFTLLEPGAPGNPAATNSTSLVVGLDTSVAGAKSGTATISLASDGTGTSGLGITPLSSQTVNVSGAVYRLASPTLNTPSVTLAARVGDPSPNGAVSVTNTSPDAFTEGLKASITAVPARFTSAGAIANLAAGATDAGSLSVGLQTGTAGSFGGTATVAFTSTGEGTTGASDVSVGSGSVTVTGRVYTPAVAQVPTQTFNFGIVHKGDVVTPQTVAVQNAAGVTALNDVLQGSFSNVSNPFTATGTLGAGVAAGATDSASLAVGMSTAAAGTFNGSATIAFASHNPDLNDLALQSVLLNLSGQVNNFANLDLEKSAGAGAFSKDPGGFVLDFGSLLEGTGIATAFLLLENDIPVGEPGDLLDVAFNIGSGAFALQGFGSVQDLAPGQQVTGLEIAFDTTLLGPGLFDQLITLQGIGHNASGFSEDLGVFTLELHGRILERGSSVPEPSSFALLLLGVLGCGVLMRRRRLAR